MARRATKLEVYDHHIVCPYCRAQVVIRSLMEQILAARRNCPACMREMMIQDGRAMKMPAEGAKKPPKQIRSHISKAPRNRPRGV